MNFTSGLQRYKHDVTGKFRDISAAVSMLDASSLQGPGAQEILFAVHEVIARMAGTSRQMIRESSGCGGAELVVSAGTWAQDLPKLHLADAVLRVERTPESTTYILLLSENLGEPLFILGKICALLPIGKIRSELESEQLNRSITHMMNWQKEQTDGHERR
jgi:hypothetical protein